MLDDDYKKKATADQGDFKWSFTKLMEESYLKSQAWIGTVRGGIYLAEHMSQLNVDKIGNKPPNIDSLFSARMDRLNILLYLCAETPQWQVPTQRSISLSNITASSQAGSQSSPKLKTLQEEKTTDKQVQSQISDGQESNTSITQNSQPTSSEQQSGLLKLRSKTLSKSYQLEAVSQKLAPVFKKNRSVSTEQLDAAKGSK